MKYFFLMCFILCGIFSIWAQEDVAYISATSGLKMRSQPTLSSEVLAVIPYQEEVEVLEILDDTGSLDIQGRCGYWCKIRWKQTSGYVFGGFLELAPGAELLRELPPIWIELDKSNSGSFFIWAGQDDTGWWYQRFFFDIDAEFHNMNFVPRYHREKPPVLVTDKYMIGPEAYKIRKVEKRNGKYIITTGSSADNLRTWEISFYDPHVIVINGRAYYVEEGFEDNYERRDPSADMGP